MACWRGREGGKTCGHNYRIKIECMMKMCSASFLWSLLLVLLASLVGVT